MRFYLRALGKYADFNGRASRKEFVHYTVFNFLFLVGAVFIDNLTGSTFHRLWFGYLAASYFLATCIPSYALQVRRRHDVGLSGWDLLSGGGFRMWHAGDVGENDYGPDPREFD